MLVLSYGYKKPQSGDKGSVFFPALEFDIQRLNDHTHDGLNSSLLSSSSIKDFTQDILAINWVSFGPGYRQLVTIPGGLQYDDYYMAIKDSTTGTQIYTTIQKVSATTFYVYCVDNSKDLTVYYT